MSIGTWAAFTSEVVRNRPRHAPRVLAAAVNARVRAGLPVGKVLSSGLWQQPFASAPDYVAYWGKGELRHALRLINWQGDGRSLVEDKLITAERYAEVGIPTPPILGVIGRDEDAYPHARRFPSLQSANAVIDALDSGPDEVIVKPAGGCRGGGIEALQRRGGTWTVGKATLDAAEIAKRLLSRGGAEGLLLQPRIRSHRGLEPVGGALGLGTARITTALLRGGPAHFFQELKIMGRPGIVDNFLGGKPGNLLASVDTATGRIVRVFGRQPNHRFLMTEVTHHPATGAPLAGFEIPLWQEALDLALRAADHCPEAPLVGADVAITDEGPMIVEINAAWDSDCPELLLGRGLRAMLREIWPDLVLDPEVKARAASMLRLSLPEAA